MRLRNAAIPVLFGFVAIAAPALADSVTVTSGPDGTTIVNGKPCRVVTLHDGGSGTTSNSSSVTTGPGGLSGSTTISPGGGGNSSSVTVGSGSASSGSSSSSAASSDCVIYKNAK